MACAAGTEQQIPECEHLGIPPLRICFPQGKPCWAHPEWPRGARCCCRCQLGAF